MLGDPRVRGVLLWVVGLAVATLILLFVGVEALVTWASDTGYRWLDYTFQVLGAFGTAVVAWFLFPSIVVAVSGVFLDRVVDATEDRLYPDLPPPRKVPLAESVAIYERGEALKRRCEELLKAAEARVEKITTDASGKPKGTAPLDVK